MPKHPLQAVTISVPFGQYNSLLAEMPDQVWHLNKPVLWKLDLKELFGYTGNFLELLEVIPAYGRDNEDQLVADLRNNFVERLIPVALEQVKKSGNTLFFDVEIMRNSGDANQARLAGYIVLRREKEIEETVLLEKNNEVDLSPLWLTHYGFNILRAMGMRKTCKPFELRKVKKMLKKEGLEIKTTEKESSVTCGSQTPTVFSSLLISRLEPTMFETVEQRLSRLADFEPEIVNPSIHWATRDFEYAEASDNKVPSATTLEWRRKRNAAGILIGIDYENNESDEFTFRRPQYNQIPCTQSLPVGMFQLLNKVSRILKLSEQVFDNAEYLCKKLTTEVHFMDTKHSLLIAVCILMAIRESDGEAPLKLKDVTNAFSLCGQEVRLRDIVRKSVEIKHKLGFS